MMCKSAFSISYARQCFFRSIANDETRLYIRTNHNAPKYKVITIDLADPRRTQVDLIPEEEDASLSDIITIGKDKFALVYKRNVSCLSLSLFEYPLTFYICIRSLTKYTSIP